MSATERVRVDDVVVTGMGATTPLGGDVKSNWAALLNGRRVAVRLDNDWPEDLPVRIAARAATDPDAVLDRIELRRLDRASQFALIAVREAWADAGFFGRAGETGQPDAERVGVVLGSGIGGLSTLVDGYEQMRARGARRLSPHTMPKMMINGSAGQVGLEINARAGVHAPTSACAAGAEAIAAGLDMIRLGRADVVAVGGTEAIIHPLTVAAFTSMKAMSRRNDDPEHASRPYDTQRDGFVMGEGAAVLILETARHARARGAHVHAELAGAGISADGHHIVAPEPGGRGASAALRKALADADLSPRDIAHVNAHATSTPQGDFAESLAIRSVLGDDGGAGADYAVSAIKSTAGHLMGASGALAALVSVLALRDRTAPPTMNIEHLDPRIGLDVVRDQPRALPRGALAGVSNSAGFGGHNVVLAFRDHE
ncbi:3-oxoacyl-[acyl-carrier-protein] synthase II [Streptomyces sp. yr375]|uniref:beta-ketoacyl-[acyl-carrier-protein] synthase family protein n=1 Tax=Streptomyces sp. yr375 TaxID=1761906 RepID=UPI0008B8E168|nr:beta-ketoacyl-[acyl-carrier-protein] synthase family protein [Streptomyces sp. yr375]SES05547.1 3-oxoacyl-[acyl-carrier-protein] synthase II [Streptomyces sp. yr375]